MHVVDNLQRCVHQVLAQRQVDQAPCAGDDAVDERLIGLLDGSILELHAERPMGVGVERHDDAAAGVAVEPVDDPRARETSCRTAGQAIGLVLADAGNAEQATVLVQHKQRAITPEDTEPDAFRKRLIYTCWQRHGPHCTMNRSIMLLAPALLAACTGSSTGSVREVGTISPTGATAPNGSAGASADERHAPKEPSNPAADWSAAEAPILTNAVQLTFGRDWVRAGENYIDPPGKRVLFQGVPQPEAGKAPDDHYAMVLADLVTGTDGKPALANSWIISPKGSANTCGWFDPKDPNRIIFATTLVAPTASNSPGYQRGTGRYRWSFPPEMRIVSLDLKGRTKGSEIVPADLKTLVGDGTAYVAEGNLSPDGRHLIYCSLATGQGDLYSLDLETGETTPLVREPGYDGGPFFSPDSSRICFRSDRTGDGHLQLFVGDLDRTSDGRIRGVSRVHQLTMGDTVNWGPFWHPASTAMAYATSELGHQNYEVFLIDSARWTTAAGMPMQRDGSTKLRVTHAAGADVLPAFSADGKRMIWTSKRGPENTSQVWLADFALPTAFEAVRTEIVTVDPQPSKEGAAAPVRTP